MLTVGLDVQNLGPTGVGTYVRNLVRGLVAHEEVRLKPYGWRRHRHAVRSLGASLHVRSPRLPLGPPRADLLHHPDFAHPAGLRRPGKIVTVHDLSFVRFPQDYPAEHTAYFHAALKRQAEDGTHFICDSTATLEDLVAYYDVGRERCSVVPLCLDNDWHSQDRGAWVRQSLSGDSRPPYLLHVGAWVPRKRLDLVLDVFEVALRDEPELRLVLVGPDGSSWFGNAAGAVRSRLARPALRDRVVLVGQATDQQVRELYASASVYLTCTRWEGFGLTVLQAMAARVPVVAPRHSSLPEVAGEYAHWVAPEASPDDYAHEVLRALRSPDHDRLERAQARANRFSVAQMAADTVDVYRRCLS